MQVWGCNAGCGEAHRERCGVIATVLAPVHVEAESETELKNSKNQTPIGQPLTHGTFPSTQGTPALRSGIGKWLEDKQTELYLDRAFMSATLGRESHARQRQLVRKDERESSKVNARGIDNQEQRNTRVDSLQTGLIIDRVAAVSAFLEKIAVRQEERESRAQLARVHTCPYVAAVRPRFWLRRSENMGTALGKFNSFQLRHFSQY
ncbi:hypothetical protein C8R43DRAFT_958840 [Mycena crocata]|nr:hypothetical protein C8R43DRAFT_958840 [Mycena crocata]